jgi:hypothetical protein
MTEHAIGYPYLQPNIGLLTQPDGLLLIRRAQQLRLGDARTMPLVAHLLRRCDGRTALADILISLPEGVRSIAQTLIAGLIDRHMITEGIGPDPPGPATIAHDLLITARYATPDWPMAVSAWQANRIDIWGDASVATPIYDQLSQCGVGQTGIDGHDAAAAQRMLIVRPGDDWTSLICDAPPADTLLLWIGKSVIWLVPITGETFADLITALAASDTGQVPMPTIAATILPALSAWSLFRAHLLRFALEPGNEFAQPLAYRLGPTCQLDGYRPSELIDLVRITGDGSSSVKERAEPEPRAIHPHFPLALARTSDGLWTWGVTTVEAEDAATMQNIALRGAARFGVALEQCLVGRNLTDMQRRATALSIALALGPSLADAEPIVDFSIIDDVAALALARLCRLWFGGLPDIQLYTDPSGDCAVAVATVIGHTAVGCDSSAGRAIAGAIGDALCAAQTGVPTARQSSTAHQALARATMGEWGVSDGHAGARVWRTATGQDLPGGYVMMIADT